MVKISLITFTYNCAKELDGLLRQIHDVVDEIIVVDGMSTDNTREIALKYNAKVFLRKPWGHPEPDRMFALKACSYDWVMYLDSDERLNKKLKSELREIIEKLQENGYVAAKIYSIIVLKGKPVLTRKHWQIRIFNKHYVEFKGIVHELPEVKGKIFELDPSQYYIFHLKGNSWSNLLRSLAKYAYLERIEIYRMHNYVEKAILALKLAPLASPIIIIMYIIRNPPYNLPGFSRLFVHSLYRTLVLTLMIFRGKKKERIAKIVQSHGLIDLLKLY